MADFRLSEDLNHAVVVQRQKASGGPGSIDAPRQKDDSWNAVLFSRDFTRISRNTVEEEFNAYSRGRLPSGYAPTIGEDAIASGIQQDDLF